MASAFAWYSRQLTARPVVTNAVSAIVLFGVGDVAAQAIERRDAGAAKAAKEDPSAPAPRRHYDPLRTARASFYGGLVFSPIVTKWWYPFLQSVKSPAGPIPTAIRRVALDQLVFAPVAGVPLYFSVMTLLEGGSTADVQAKLANNYWPTMLANWYVWPAVQFANFLWVPPHLRILLVNGVSIAWNTFLSLQNARKRIIPEG